MLAAGTAMTTRTSKQVCSVSPPHYQGMNMAEDWPLKSFLELGPLSTAVPCARLHTKQLLWEMASHSV